jgi:phosphatidylglycerol---prolipoprotein diacylglyceryl transferase
MLPILNVGPLALPVPAMMILTGIWICIYLSEKFAPRFGLSSSKISSLIILILLSGMLGARIAYIVRYPDAFIHQPLDILSRSPGLLDPWGGIVLAVIVGIIYGQKKGLPFWTTLDALTPGLAVLAISIGFSNLASGAAFGKPTDLPWGIYLWGDYRHPTQIYGIILFASLFGFILLTMKIWVVAKSGMLFLIFLASSAAIYLFIEAFNGDSLLFNQTYRTLQIIAWLVLALSLWGIRERIAESVGTSQVSKIADTKELK